MRYELPNGEIVDLGNYTIDDCIPIQEMDESELKEILFKQSGIIIADTKGGENDG